MLIVFLLGLLGLGIGVTVVLFLLTVFGNRAYRQRQQDVDQHRQAVQTQLNRGRWDQ